MTADDTWQKACEIVGIKRKADWYYPDRDDPAAAMTMLEWYLAILDAQGGWGDAWADLVHQILDERITVSDALAAHVVASQERNSPMPDTTIFGPSDVVLATAAQNQPKFVKIRLIKLSPDDLMPIIQLSDGKEPESWLPVSAILSEKA